MPGTRPGMTSSTFDVVGLSLCHWRDRRERHVGLFPRLIAGPLMNAFPIRLRVVTDADAVGDRPVEAGREQNVRAGELVAHQINAAVAQGGFDVPQLLAEIF